MNKTFNLSQILEEVLNAQGGVMSSLQEAFRKATGGLTSVNSFSEIKSVAKRWTESKTEVILFKGRPAIVFPGNGTQVRTAFIPLSQLEDEEAAFDGCLVRWEVPQGVEIIDCLGRGFKLKGEVTATRGMCIYVAGTGFNLDSFKAMEMVTAR